MDTCVNFYCLSQKHEKLSRKTGHQKNIRLTLDRSVQLEMKNSRVRSRALSFVAMPLQLRFVST